MNWLVPIAVAIVLVLAFNFVWEWVMFAKKARSPIARAHQGASVVLYQRALILLSSRFPNEPEHGRISAAVINICAGSSTPETNQFPEVRERSGEVRQLASELVDADAIFRELSVQAQRMALIEASLRHGAINARSLVRHGPQHIAAAGAAWEECAWFVLDGALSRYEQLPKSRPAAFERLIMQVGTHTMTQAAVPV